MSTAVPTSATQKIYEIDPVHSHAQFSVRHMMITNVKGEFTKLTGEVILDDSNPSASRVVAVIDATSINTREQQRDTHLKSPDFLDVAKFPEIRFESRSVERKGPEEYNVTGGLTIHGVTREVVLSVEGPAPEVKDPWSAVRSGATATTKINRKDFGLVWNQALEAGGVLVGEEVKIAIEVELIRKTAPVA
ncbi:MAG TPA: YceI family protein [Bryobacteraceae bacterium]|nr:YceI family protein [Bryobacteraceae bacterium]